MNEFLKTRGQIESSTTWLGVEGYITHPISCKDWELAIIVEALERGDLVDLGADGSFVLHNAIRKRAKQVTGEGNLVLGINDTEIDDFIFMEDEIFGGYIKLQGKGVTNRMVGIDLLEVKGDNRAEGAEYFIGDLMHTPFNNEEFDTVVSQSVIEHEVNLAVFAEEAGRLLKSGGFLIVSFDYWPQKVNTAGKTLYGLEWNILDDIDVKELVENCKKNGLELTSEIDWTTQDAVINDKYCSPFAGISYTFGILEFIKQ